MSKRFKLLLLIFVAFTTGALAQSSDMLNGQFTVSAYGAKIAFSKGNLQQIDGNWQFAEHQYDYLGDSQDRNSTTRDVFKFNDYSLPNNDDSWFVMSSNQWKYLLTTRSVTNTLSDGARYTMATLGGTYKGLILFPDSYTHPDGTDFTPGVYNDASDYTATVSLEGWSLMEAAGCVFLPATGYYSVDGVWRYVGDGVVYSSSTILGDIYHRYTPWFRIDETHGPVVELEDGNAWCHISSYVPIRLVWSFLEKDDDGYYLLGSLQDWKDFASLVQETTTVNARMTADIDLGDDQTMIGTDNGRYSSTFDGQGHTLTVHYVTTHDGCAPFLYIENATIKNIHVAGTINTSHRRAAGLVANSYGTSYVSNSWSSVALISSAGYTDAERGGFVSCVQTGTLTINDSYFDGTLTAGGDYTWGGFVGWRKSTSIINNCLFNPNSVSITNTEETETFSNNGGTVTNCYYIVRIGNSTQGTQIPDGQLADGSIAFKLQQNRADLIWGQRIGIDPAPVLTSDESYRVYKSKNGGYTNDPDFAYTGLEQDAEDYYLLGSEWAWIDFAALVQTTPTANAKMTADIDLGDDQTTIGHPNENPSYHFKGIFDGNGHTLTVHYVKQGEKDICSPFPNISEATIKNIHITGTIESSTACQPAVIGCVRYGTTTIQNVWSSVELTSTKTSWCEASGLVGCVDGYKNGHLVMTDCMVSGNIISSGSYEGCFIGYINNGGSATVTNCLSIANFTYNGTSGFMGNYTNCYVKQFPSSIPAAMQVTNDDLADGTTASALGSNWVQDPVLNQPMLKIFANYVNHVTGYGDSEESDHWVFIASPVAGNLLPTAVENLVAATATNYDLYRFNQSGANGEWENYKAHTEGFVLENGKGYLYANKNDANLTFAGVLNLSASMEVPLDYNDGSRLAGYNLVGNPFTEAAYIDRTYFKMNNDGDDVVPVENYNEEAIPALTGVVVVAASDNEKVTFSKAAPVSSTGNKGSLQMTLTKANVRGNAFQDKAIVSFNEGAQLGKYIFNENHAKLYIPQNGNDYAIAFSNGQGEMPLNFKAKENAEYTITVNSDGVELDYLHLIDNISGADIDLLATPSYTFTARNDDFPSRFKLVFGSNDNDNQNEDFAFISDGEIIINGEGTLQVIDMLGRTIVTHRDGACTVSTDAMVPGVYVLRLVNGENVRTQKIIIK